MCMIHALKSDLIIHTSMAELTKINDGREGNNE